MKADTMNEKTIELSDILSAALQSGVAHNNGAGGQYLLCATEPQLVKFAAVIAGRFRAASEPGEVASFDAWWYGWDGVRQRQVAYLGWPCTKELAASIWNDARLASMATSPASEAQAGWSAGTEDADGNPLVTVRADELRALAEFASGPGLSAWRIDGDMMQRDVLATRMQVVAANALASAPQPASSPVAAEGQKAEAPLLDSIEVARLWEAFRITDEGQRAVEYLVDRSIVSHLSTVHGALFVAFRAGLNATPTASMADAAEAPMATLIVKREYHDNGQGPRDTKGYILAVAVAHDDAEKLPLGRYRLYAHPLPEATLGPRGENAGGVVEALSEQTIMQAGFDNAKVLVGDFAIGARWAQRACATAWGLRIAEKGDAS